MDGKVRILFLAANPLDMSRLRLDEEARQIDKKIRSADFRDDFDLIPFLAAQPSDLHEALLRHKPHILHFSGHGNRTQGVMFQDNEGNAAPVKKEVLGSLLGILRDNIRVVVLNACYSKSQSGSIIKAIDYTVVMNKPIHDESAVAFSASFYRALAFGRTVKESFDLGVNELLLLGVPGHKTPEIVIRSGVDSAGDSLIKRERETPPQGATAGSGNIVSAVGQSNVSIGGSADGAKISTGGGETGTR